MKDFNQSTKQKAVNKLTKNNKTYKGHYYRSLPRSKIQA